MSTATLNVTKNKLTRNWSASSPKAQNSVPPTIITRYRMTQRVLGLRSRRIFAYRAGSWVPPLGDTGASGIVNTLWHDGQVACRPASCGASASN